LALTAGIAAALALVAQYRDVGRDVGSETDDAHAAHEAALAERAAAPVDVGSDDPATSAPGTGPAGPSRTERDLAWQTGLRDAPESFRNSTLLITIRENGFPCDDVTSAQQGGDAVRSWHVTCRGALAYLVGVGASGQLVVEPMPMGDGLGLIVGPFESLPPEQRQNPLGPTRR
jgi:hypothetical protein